MRQFSEPNEPHAFHELGKNPSDIINTRMEYLMNRVSERAKQVRGESTYKGKNLEVEGWKEKGEDVKSYRDAFKEIEEEETLSDDERVYLKDFVHNHLGNPMGKNPSDFWEINTQPTNDYWCPKCQNFVKMNNLKCISCGTKVLSHFAVFPETLVVKPILSSCPQWLCKKCGQPRTKITKVTQVTNRQTDFRNPEQSQRDRCGNYEHKIVGYNECKCGVGFESGVVLDPFCGSGTTLVVAKKLGRKYIGIDLSLEYCNMSRKRLSLIPNKLSDY